MPEYRRVFQKGGVYFFTLVTYQRREIFKSSTARELFLGSMHHVSVYRPYIIEAYCILPDHVHLLWRLPEDDSDYSTRMSEIKRRFTKHYIKNFGSFHQKTASQLKRREGGIWQRRFWEHCISNQADLDRHINYIHYNPVKHELVPRVRDWESSSFFDYVLAGYYDLNWGENYSTDNVQGQYGE